MEVRGVVLADSNDVRSSTCERKSIRFGEYESYVFLDVTPYGFVGK